MHGEPACVALQYFSFGGGKYTKDCDPLSHHSRSQSDIHDGDGRGGAWESAKAVNKWNNRMEGVKPATAVNKGPILQRDPSLLQ